ncbi:GNAT family N-acetyltransferase [bacterium]|nr:GNAT family N-acetyltransferase [bacterium]
MRVIGEEFVRIRPARPGDCAQLAEIYAPYCATPISFESQAPGAQEMESRLRGLWPTHPWLVAEREGRLLGFAYAGPHRQREAYGWTVESSIYLRAEAQGTGTGRRLYQELLDLVRRQGFRTVLAGITLPNPASQTLHERLGFQPVGVYPAVGFKGGEWRSVLWLSLHFQGDEPSDLLWLPEVDPENWSRASLVSKRLELRPLGPGHEAALLDYIRREKERLLAAFPVMSRAVHDPQSAVAFVRTKLLEWYRRQSYAFGVFLQGQLVGTLTLKHFDWSVPKGDAGYSLGGAWQGQGLASEALSCVLPFARDQLGLRRLYLRIHPSNVGSQRVAEKCGFQREGLLRHDFLDGTGEPQDVLYYSVVW